MARHASIHLGHSRKVDVVDNVGRDDLLNLDGRRHEVEQRRVEKVTLDETGLNGGQPVAEARFLRRECRNLGVEFAEAAGVLAELRLEPFALRRNLLNLEIQLIDPDAKFGYSASFCLGITVLSVPGRLEVVAIDVIGGLGKLRSLVRPV
jgi:hypothetical protein